jgi:uncharacterized membrane protein YfcA
MIELVVTLLNGVFVGLSLGLTGGGGSNFAVPLLIYAIGMAPSQAMPASLASVAIIAAIGASHAIRNNLITWKPTLIFAVGGMVGSPLGLKLAHGLDEQLLLKGFAVLALLVGSSMWWRAWRNPQESNVVRALPENDINAAGPVCSVAQDGKLTFTAPCSVALALAGLTTGLLAGFFGVGGGFIIVPALMLIIRMGIHSAVATSLVIIALTGFTGSVYAILKDSIVWSVMLLFAFGGVIGMLIGRHWAAKIAGPLLQKVFATAVVLTASAILLKPTFS